VLVLLWSISVVVSLLGHLSCWFRLKVYLIFDLLGPALCKCEGWTDSSHVCRRGYSYLVCSDESV
jgi:hypothetical protein